MDTGIEWILDVLVQGIPLFIGILIIIGSFIAAFFYQSQAPVKRRMTA